MTRNKPERRFETVLVESEKPLNLRVFVQLIVQKINRGEMNNIDKRKV